MRALVVEDDELLAVALAEQLEGWCFSVEVAHDLAQARAKLAASFDVVLLDLLLGEASVMPLAREICELRPLPVVVAVSGTASAAEAFELAQLGVRGYLPKPIAVLDLQATLSELIGKGPPIEVAAKAQVGKLSYQDATDRVRKAMVREALARTRGNRTGAARILRLSRQAVQQLIRDLELDSE